MLAIFPPAVLHNVPDVAVARAVAGEPPLPPPIRELDKATADAACPCTGAWVVSGKVGMPALATTTGISPLPLPFSPPFGTFSFVLLITGLQSIHLPSSKLLP